MNKSVKNLIWLVIALLGAWAYVVLATRRGEAVNSVYILIAALCSYAIGYRFYSKWIAARILALDDRRATPRSEEHTSELQSHSDLVCRLLLEKKKAWHPHRRVYLAMYQRLPELLL